ncbi:sigma-54-dependent Fis family transcriptional regulator [Sulfoacidibacillus thermotolerans]|uniref:Sigma-54-dependent Fis family transcriptional regulator n=1 Tax=Sulfoacidibacillus thermotolerans TaxID=1765684 RepID=A0A2U3D850_SULT2|nr:sigma-54-dependent Fis family transcriptional regulator [Sulfoacidibacillus thermotolerans]
MTDVKDESILKKAWDRFVRSEEVNGPWERTVDAAIFSSWQRSRAYGVDPWQIQGARCLSPEEIQHKKHAYRELIEISIPLMEQLYDLVKGSGFMVTLCDQNGILIKVIGDEQTLQHAQEIQFVEGADWSEQAMGTNAIGTCLYLDSPLQVFAAEHYSLACQWWTCSAAPIHRFTGERIGVLNMSGPSAKVHAHTLGMVVSAVWAIENQIRLIEKNRNDEMMQRYLEATVQALNDGVAIVDDALRILKVNALFLKIFGLSEADLQGVFLERVLQFQGDSHLLSGSRAITHKELKVFVPSSSREVRVFIDIQPIFGKHSEKMGSLVLFKEVKKVRQLVNHITDSRAKVTFSDIIGQTDVFVDCLTEAKLAARSDATVLLMGESGTGKDLFAQAIHHESLRRNKPFIAINCGAIPRDLLGSELFGYVEGAFTGARKGGSAGKFELADGGTLFLDEIGEMSLEMQVLLLRVLQSKEIIRIGGQEVLPVDVRMIAATNKDLHEEVLRGHFREDLFYRLHVIPIHLPALRERKQDIPLFVEHFIKQFSEQLGRNVHSMAPDALLHLMHAPWAGNVRELQNVLERAVLRANGGVLSLEHLPKDLLLKEQVEAYPRALNLPIKEEIKKDALIRSIRQCRGNFKEAAKYLGISRSTLYRQLDKYGLRAEGRGFE